MQTFVEIKGAASHLAVFLASRLDIGLVEQRTEETGPVAVNAGTLLGGLRLMMTGPAHAGAGRCAGAVHAANLMRPTPALSRSAHSYGEKRAMTETLHWYAETSGGVRQMRTRAAVRLHLSAVTCLPGLKASVRAELPPWTAESGRQTVVLRQQLEQLFMHWISTTRPCWTICAGYLTGC